MGNPVPETVIEKLQHIYSSSGTIVVLTGAGISAESGIPTFRGKDGYWTVGSNEYQPQEMATFAMFQRHPEDVWAWYLYRLGICNAAQPNAGHLALVELEKELKDRFKLITQNVDGLHIRAGNSLERIYQIHGNINYARCARECGQKIRQLPQQLGVRRERYAPLTLVEKDHLQCPSCGAWLRPHVLWFDEYYDEEHFRFDSSIRTALSADALLVVGTSGATNLPMQVGQRAAQSGALIIDINIHENPFSRLAQQNNGYFISGQSALVLPEIARAMFLA